MKPELVLALDVPNRDAAVTVLGRVRRRLRWVKIGMQLYYREGPDFVREVADLGFRVFLDLKLHDIPHTMAAAVRSIATLPVGMTTIHLCAGSEGLRAGLEAARDARPDLLLLGVTVLTSADQGTLRETGVAYSPEAQVVRLARVGHACGLRGLVCSPLEIEPLRRELGGEAVLVVPGIRPAFSTSDDQKRTLTPAQAADAGATFLVVGRPILKAADPAEAALLVLGEIES